MSPYVVRMGKIRYSYRIFSEKARGKHSLGKSRKRIFLILI
jgi:hypothetical protein